jgi:hypothetical protein
MLTFSRGNRPFGIRFRRIVWLWVWLVLLPVSASAQADLSLRLGPPQTKSFPRIEAYLDVRDSKGDFVHNLHATSLNMLEDEVSIPVATVEEIHPGAQIVVAFNPGSNFAVRNSQGKSRYELLMNALQGWANNRQGQTQDDWSFTTTGGANISHLSDPAEWITRVVSTTVNLNTAAPSLDVLSSAIDLASDPSPRPGMGRAVLFITPPLTGDQTATLENLASRAKQQGIYVYVWMVAPAGAPVTKTSNALMQFVEQTGGQFFVFSGDEPLPDPETFFDPLRSIYHISYDSRLRSSGSHQLVAEMQTDSGPVKSNPQVFELTVEPPNPAFIAPALNIQRKPPPDNGDQTAAEPSVENYLPTDQTLQVLIDFPDGEIRPLVRTALYVDGKVVATNTAPPFDKFNWDLRPYTTNGSHLLKVEAEDSLGLVGQSMETMVQISVERLQPNPLRILTRNAPILAGLAILLAGAVLLLVLVVGGRIRPKSQGFLKKVRRRSDPVTQPVTVKHEAAPHRLPGWVNRLQWPQRRITTKANAFLTRISDTDLPATSTPIPITADEITLGCDPNQATLLINDPSVGALHARLVHTPDNSYRLADESSVAGTWINYTPISREGAKLEHGDLVHIGRACFRFTLRQPGPERKPVITLQEPPG